MSMALMLGLAYGAEAQTTVECEGFYVRVADKMHIQIGTRAEGEHFVEDEEKIDVEIYSGATTLEGYEQTGREFGDPDFYINKERTEICTMKMKEARQFIRCLKFVKADAKIQVDLEGGKSVMWTIPQEQKQEIIKAYESMDLNIM